MSRMRCSDSGFDGWLIGRRSAVEITHGMPFFCRGLVIARVGPLCSRRLLSVAAAQ